MKLVLFPVPPQTCIRKTLIFLALLGVGLSGPIRKAHADAMDEALSNYSRSMNEYYKGLSAVKTPEDQQKLQQQWIQPAGDKIQKAFEDQSAQTFTKFGISIGEERSATPVEVPLKEIQERIAHANLNLKPVERALASDKKKGGASPAVETPAPEPSSEPVSVSGEQKVEQIVYGSPTGPRALVSPAPRASKGK